jgi:altronate dehydratase small subunit
MEVCLMNRRRGVIIDARDNVANVLENVAAGETIAAICGAETVTLQALEDIPFGFKVALADLSPGDPVYKYGEMIGRASRQIRRGALVHIHNIEGLRGRGDLHPHNS